MEGLGTFDEWEQTLKDLGYMSRGEDIGSFRKNLSAQRDVYIYRRINGTWAVHVLLGFRFTHMATGFATPVAAHVYAEVQGWTT